ncbi:DUF481 domain-containing protein [Muricauda sp. CAU 1633]|uniref:DUF481 domain-containing protein n=1 Tax=Allomuricauda sp. CAU 1633 TaxID=2816036 RepID=UPI001A8D575F|nr:DUF481 domain-containing protein [Muricauda sp. CAU 1633]MBO0322276.1 DUF481 domain-containing protein [Muricauda sp. CAU 1633]
MIKFLRYVCFLLLAFSGLKIHAQSDTIVLKNQDKLVGEIKRMSKGVLTMETDYSDSDFEITWLEVLSMSSEQTYFVTLTKGYRFESKIRAEQNEHGVIYLKRVDTSWVKVPVQDVVEFKAVKSNFISRISTSISLGYNFTKSNNLSQFVVNGTLSYVGFKWEADATYNSVVSKQEDVSGTKRIDAGLNFRYFLERDWFLDSNASFLSNNQIDLDLRTNLRAGVGKYLVHNNSLYLGLGGGLAWNNEQYLTAQGADKNSFESYVGLEFNMFDMGDLDFFTRMLLYPSLTESGRLRSDITANLKYDLPLDLFIKIGFTYNYDNQPAEGFLKDDYVFNTTFGWEFN